MNILLLSQEESHPFYKGVNSYFSAPLEAAFPGGCGRLLGVPPLGTALLAAAAREKGLSADIVHNYFSLPGERARLERLLALKPLAVGISTTHLFTPELAAATAALVSELSPASRLIMGGPGAEWNEDLRPENAITVLGPGEGTLPLLVSALRDGSPLHDVPNLVFSDGGRKIETRREANSPLSAVPYPDWGMFSPAPRRVLVQGSRGCPRSCAFCSYSSDYSLRPAAGVAAEIRRNREKWGITSFRFSDSGLAESGEWAMRLCAELARDGGYSWSCFARADTMAEPGIAGAFARAGCRSIFAGVESGSDRMLEAMGKGCRTAGMLDGIRAAKEAGIAVHGNFVVGFPGEDAVSIRETMDFAAGSGLDTVYFSPFQVRSASAPVYRKRELCGLEVAGGSWRHAGMDSAQALEFAGEMTRTVAMEMERPVISSEIFFSFFAGETGSAEDQMELPLAIRDWHRAETAGDLSRRSAAEERIRSIVERPQTRI